MNKIFSIVVAVALLAACTQNKPTTIMSNISESVVEQAVKQLLTDSSVTDAPLLRRGVGQVAQFWKAEDGTAADFIQFCYRHFAKNQEAKAALFTTLQRNWEILWGYYNKMNMELKTPLHVVGSPIQPIDEVFGAIEPSSHFTDDMFANKIAFITVLNFPYFSLSEKNELGKQWSRQEWAYARMGDIFTSRVPAQVKQNIANAVSAAEVYISDYNIAMGNLRNEAGETLFPAGMNLISHWGLRDELKANYANSNNGLEKQRMIYAVMNHIVNQTIPAEFINNDKYSWNPITNTLVDKGGQPVTFNQETLARYQYLYNIYKAEISADSFNPTYSTYLQRAFDQNMEVSCEEIEAIFTDFVSSPVVAEVAKFISLRLGRPLEPFDIWYDGFKTRSSKNEDDLTSAIAVRYPNAAAYERSIPGVLVNIGFSLEKANRIAGQIAVDATRGSGHAWGAQIRGDKARLRTRIPATGMDYKGYNIASHELGHNVEQTISLNDVDHYVMNGVPNTAFTEALAFVFQKRDLEFLGIWSNLPKAPESRTLDVFWGCYEIMGVSLLDIRVWRWLYANPQASVADFKSAVIQQAKEIWNTYYAPVLGGQDSPILGIYSHMISIPLYLPNYPYGHLIEFQLEQQFSGKNIAAEIQRIYPAGRLTPNEWMQNAVGSPVSAQPLKESAGKALKEITEWRQGK